MVAKRLMVTGEAEDILYAQGVGAKDVALDGDAISIPAGHLNHWLQSILAQNSSCGNAGKPDYGCLVVGDIRRINVALQVPDLAPHQPQVRAFRRAQLSGNCKMA